MDTCRKCELLTVKKMTSEGFFEAFDELAKKFDIYLKFNLQDIRKVNVLDIDELFVLKKLNSHEYYVKLGILTVIDGYMISRFVDEKINDIQAGHRIYRRCADSDSIFSSKAFKKMLVRYDDETSVLHQIASLTGRGFRTCKNWKYGKDLPNSEIVIKKIAYLLNTSVNELMCEFSIFYEKNVDRICFQKIVDIEELLSIEFLKYYTSNAIELRFSSFDYAIERNHVSHAKTPYCYAYLTTIYAKGGRKLLINYPINEDVVRALIRLCKFPVNEKILYVPMIALYGEVCFTNDTMPIEREVFKWNKDLIFSAKQFSKFLKNKINREDILEKIAWELGKSYETVVKYRVGGKNKHKPHSFEDMQVIASVLGVEVRELLENYVVLEKRGVKEGDDDCVKRVFFKIIQNQKACEDDLISLIKSLGKPIWMFISSTKGVKYFGKTCEYLPLKFNFQIKTSESVLIMANLEPKIEYLEKLSQIFDLPLVCPWSGHYDLLSLINIDGAFFGTDEDYFDELTLLLNEIDKDM